SGDHDGAATLCERPIHCGSTASVTAPDASAARGRPERATGGRAPALRPVRRAEDPGLPHRGPRLHPGPFMPPTSRPPSRSRALPKPGDPLRVAFLIYRGNPHCGGQGVYSRHLTRELTELGHTVTMFAGQPWPVADAPVTLEKVPGLDLYRRDNPFRVPWP